MGRGTGEAVNWPEMSLTAYRNATAWGVDALEISVARTSDGVFFGLHDETLDRTSGITGSVKPDTLTWSQLTARYRNKLNSSSPEGESYTRASDVFSAFASDHVIFVDTKYVSSTQQRSDLINLMLSYAPASHWVLKDFYDDLALTVLAHRAGIQTWGYYYSKDLAQLDRTAPNWDLLGLAVDASAAEWDQVKAKGQPVIAFEIRDQARLAEALAKGADGMMTASVPTVLGKPRSDRANCANPP